MRGAVKLFLMVVVTTSLAGCGDNDPGGSDPPSGMTHQPGMTHSPGMTHGLSTDVAAIPTETGQAAFAAIQELVELLEADPATDWTSVNITAVRGHLVDMNDVTLQSKVAQTNTPAGFNASVTGEGRTVEAIRRMLPAHAQAIQGLNGWEISVSDVLGGVRVEAMAPSSSETAHLQALGVFGTLASGAHHQDHHLALAKGLPMH